MCGIVTGDEVKPPVMKGIIFAHLDQRTLLHIITEILFMTAGLVTSMGTLIRQCNINKPRWRNIRHSSNNSSLYSSKSEKVQAQKCT